MGDGNGLRLVFSYPTNNGVYSSYAMTEKLERGFLASLSWGPSFQYLF